MLALNDQIFNPDSLQRRRRVGQRRVRLDQARLRQPLEVAFQ